MKKLFLLLLIGLSMVSCKSYLWRSSQDISLTDTNSTRESRYLLGRIKEISKVGYAFGHQDATAYGVNWKNSPKRYQSDVNDVAGDFPGVYGFEIGHIELGHDSSLDTVSFDLIKDLVRKAHKQKGIVTISWHPDNPTSNGSAWDTTTTVVNILKGGSLHKKYDVWLSKVATFMKDLKTRSGKTIPVVFRPYHEMNGNWFWWGSMSCTPKEFKTLWKETVDILSNKYDVHNLLYCYSTDEFGGDKEAYLKYYPGDAYVDILGVDLYHKSTPEIYTQQLHKNLGALQQIAKEKGKPFALTEGGMETLPIADWWTNVLDKNISEKDIAWALVWRNARKSHFYAPYKGHKSEEDFRKFSALEHVLFLEEIKKIR